MRPRRGGRSATRWLDEEPPLHLGRRLWRLLRRGALNPVVPLSVTLVVVSVLVALMAARPEPFRSTVVLSITEPDLAPRTAPRVYRQLRAHVRDVLLSRERLLAIVRARGLRPALLARSPERAVEALREDIEVVVWRNYFLEERDPDSEAPRSARLSITCTANDAEVARAVVSDLAEAAVESSLLARVADAKRALGGIEAAMALRRSELEVRRTAQARADLWRVGSPRGPHDLAVADRSAINESLSRSLGALENLWALQDRELRQEQLRLGLRFELVQAGYAMAPRGSRWTALALRGAVLFAVLLPLSFLAVGAFDGRLQAAEDVEALGLTFLGRVPSRPAAPAA